MSNEIIFFQENQVISKLYTKWWKEKSGGVCTSEEPKKSSALGVTNVGGVFVVLIGGMVVGFLIALVEFMWKAGKNARVDKVKLLNYVLLRFQLSCYTTKSTNWHVLQAKTSISPGIRPVLPESSLSRRRLIRH